MKGEIEGSRRKKRAQEFRRKIKSLRGETKGADSAEGRDKMHEGENNTWRGETKEYAEK